MKNLLIVVCLLGCLAAQAQTAPKSATSTAKTTAHPGATRTGGTSVKLPPGVPVVAGPVTTAFSLRYQEIKVGTGEVAEPLKTFKVQYTGYRALDGVKFDSSEDHRSPLMGPDGKPQLDAAGKPKLGPPQPLTFPQGMGRLIPGFDQGVIGMHIGGKRRLFIPYQLAYGTHEFPDHPGHPGIPAKSDLIFDIELVDIADTPQQQMPHPAPAGVPTRPGGPAGQPATPPPSSAPAGQTAPTGSTVPATPPPPQPKQ